LATITMQLLGWGALHNKG